MKSGFFGRMPFVGELAGGDKWLIGSQVKLYNPAISNMPD